jgi:hypothetical protein
MTSGAELVDQTAQLRFLRLGPSRDLTRLLALALGLEVEHAIHLVRVRVRVWARLELG